MQPAGWPLTNADPQEAAHEQCPSFDQVLQMSRWTYEMDRSAQNNESHNYPDKFPKFKKPDDYLCRTKLDQI